MIDGVKRRARRLTFDLTTLILNCAGFIPCWTIRKVIYRLFGMKIGQGSRILMGARIQGPKGIAIGEHTYINSRCHLDGRGGLVIGSNVNISNYSKLITAAHDMKSSTFEYRAGKVVIDDYVWIGTGAIVLDRSHLEQGVVLGAGSVFKGKSERKMVYCGVPAQPVKERAIKDWYDVSWKPFFI